MINITKEKNKEYFNKFNLSLENNDIHIIYNDNVKIGIIKYREYIDNTIYLDLLEIEKPYRKKGFGTKVIEKFKDKVIFGDSLVQSVGFWKSIGADFSEQIDNLEEYEQTNSCIPFCIW